MLSYIKNKELINKQKLQGFPKEAEELLAEYTKMPKQRAEKILLSAGMRNCRKNSTCERVWKKSELYNFCKRINQRK